MAKGCLATTADKFVALLLAAGLFFLAVNNPSEDDFRQELTAHVRGQLADTADDHGPLAMLGVALFSGGILRSVIDEIPVRRTNFLLFSKFDVDLNSVPFLRDPRARNPCFIGVMGWIFACPGNGQRVPQSQQAAGPEPSRAIIRTDGSLIDSSQFNSEQSSVAETCHRSWVYFPPKMDSGVAIFIALDSSGKYRLEASDYSGGQGSYQRGPEGLRLIDDRSGFLATIDRCAPDAVLTFNDGRRFRLETGRGSLEEEAARRGVSVAEPVG